MFNLIDIYIISINNIIYIVLKKNHKQFFPNKNKNLGGFPPNLKMK